MPRVGSQKFPYTPAGEKAAKDKAAATGKPLKMTKPMPKGGKK